MTSEERERMNQLCERIQNEKNPQRFTKLVEQLNKLLERKEKRLESKRRTSQKKRRRGSPGPGEWE